MSQSFSLYTELTVRQNLDAARPSVPSAGASGEGAHRTSSSRSSASATISTSAALDLPLGIRQRLSLAVAIVHEPEIADPRRADLRRRSAGARRVLGAADRSVAQSGRDDLRLDAFHERGGALRPHLADGCGPRAGDRHASRACQRARGAATLEDAFISYLEEAAGLRRPGAATPATSSASRLRRAAPHRSAPRLRSALQRLFAYTIRETLELAARSDPARLRAVRHGASDDGLRIRHLDRRQQSLLRRARSRPEPRKPRLSRGTRGSPYFAEKPPLTDYADLERAAARAATSKPRSKSRPVSGATSSAAGRPRSAPGSMARCRSAPRRSAAICRACTSTISPIRR